MRTYMIKTMSLALLLSSVACTKTEKIVQQLPVKEITNNVNTVTSSTPEGIETHGGSVKLSRQQTLIDRVLLKEEDFPATYQNVSSHNSLKSLSYYTWASLMFNKSKPKAEVQKIIDKMLYPEDGKEDVFQSIIEAKFDIKEMVPLGMKLTEEEIRNSKKYGFCLNEEGLPTSASTKLGEMFSPICLDMKILVDENPNHKELVALFSHELAHHYGFSHEEATALQNYIASFEAYTNQVDISDLYVGISISELNSRWRDLVYSGELSPHSSMRIVFELTDGAKFAGERAGETFRLQFSNGGSGFFTSDFLADFRVRVVTNENRKIIETDSPDAFDQIAKRSNFDDIGFFESIKLEPLNDNSLVGFSGTVKVELWQYPIGATGPVDYEFVSTIYEESLEGFNYKLGLNIPIYSKDELLLIKPELVEEIDKNDHLVKLYQRAVSSGIQVEEDIQMLDKQNTQQGRQ